MSFTKAFQITAAPAQAAAAGYNTLTFYEDFTSNTIAPLASTLLTPGTNWYWSPGVDTGAFTASGPFSNPSWTLNTTAHAGDAAFGGNAGNNSSTAGGILTLNNVRPSGNTGSVSTSLLTTVPKGMTSVPTQGVFGPCYSEYYFRCPPKAAGTQPTNDSWPAIWAWGVEGYNSFWGNTGSTLTAAVDELDHIEIQIGVVGFAQTWTMNFHDPAGAFGTGAGNFYNTISTTGDSNWHTLGILWVHGNLKFYYDNTLIAPTAGITTTAYPLDNTHIFLILQTGVAYPLYIDWCRVWQAP